MRNRHPETVLSIQVKITSLILACLMVTIFSILMLALTRQKQSLLLAADETLSVGSDFLNQSIRAIMLDGKAPLVARTIENLQSVRHLEHLTIYRTDGTSAFHDYSTLEAVNDNQNTVRFERTERLQYAELHDEHFEEVLRSKTPVRVELMESQSLDFYFPLLNRPECRMCHGQKSAVLGVLHFGTSVAGVHTLIRQSRLLLSGILIVAGLSIAAVLILSLRRMIVHPLNRIGTTVQRVGKGDFDVQIRIDSRDELGVIARHTNDMIRGLKERTQRIQLTQDVTILSLAGLAETRDPETGSHILRTQHYVRTLAEYLTDLGGAEAELLYKSAPLHDIGKVGVPDAILLKPGPLTEEEWEEMRKHPIYGYEALRLSERSLGSNSFLRVASEIALCHHEKWNGSGYPRGLAGAAIPLSGRLMALADVYDALINKRVYKNAFTHDQAKELILEGRSSHFDPDVVDAFMEREREFVEIASRYRG